MRRQFRAWRFMMTVDRTQPNTPEEIAINHYHNTLKKMMVVKWYQLVRGRGKLVRYRNEIFYKWKKWAPMEKKMSVLTKKATDWLRLNQIRRVYDIMAAQCFHVIGHRTKTLKELRRNFCSRKLVICAYALLNKDTHVIMVDCWRKLKYFWNCRKNWKSFQWHYRYTWYTNKTKG